LRGIEAFKLTMRGSGPSVLPFLFFPRPLLLLPLEGTTDLGWAADAWNGRDWRHCVGEKLAEEGFEVPRLRGEVTGDKAEVVVREIEREKEDVKESLVKRLRSIGVGMACVDSRKLIAKRE
jgi:hypothetical protein